MATKSKSAALRARLSHPVLDSDGHLVEYVPVLGEYLQKAGGNDAVKAFRTAFKTTYLSLDWYKLSPAQRREQWARRPPFYVVPAKNTLDLATALMPKLLHERLDELGFDYTVLYPSMGLHAPMFADPEIRHLSCRALNDYYADLFTEYGDRMTPAALIPMHTPQEAVAELDYAIGKRGLKVVMLPNYIKRPIAAAGKYPEAGRYAFRLDTYGIDSDYDYDPVWAKCQELGVVPTFHSPGEGWGSRTSISSFVYNHIGHFAAAGEASAKSLFLGGVTRRFPKLKFLFLEGGVGWARSLLADLVGHWEKRNINEVTKYDPRRVDREQLAGLFQRYGGKLFREAAVGRESAQFGTNIEDPAMLDEFARCAITSKEGVRDLFVPNFYFGCEADDPVTASAFDAKRNPFGARLNVVFGSDIGHFDVPDMSEVTQEAWEMVEHGMISEDDFRDFVFANPARLWTAVNPAFFKGTPVESAVSSLLAQ
ncbi:MAG TPA: amidohydrolase family protein [Candidatus Binataceae bacterium]|nr:amidohydrolase family protein [Candidatus Binataceae bacterium]